MPGANLQDKKHGLVGGLRWVPVKGKPCDYVRRGVIVHGGPLQVLDVCISKACKKHHPKRTSTAVGGAVATVNREAERKHQEALYDHDDKERKWKHGCFDAIGHQVVRVALEHVPTDAVIPSFGRLILAALPTRRNSEALETVFKVEAGEDGDLVPKLTDEQIAPAIVLCVTWRSDGLLPRVGRLRGPTSRTPSSFSRGSASTNPRPSSTRR